MSKEIVKEEIIRILESIIEQTQTIDAHKGKIPQIELDLVQDNIRQLYQNFMYLDRINQEEHLESFVKSGLRKNGKQETAKEQEATKEDEHKEKLPEQKAENTKEEGKSAESDKETSEEQLKPTQEKPQDAPKKEEPKVEEKADKGEKAQKEQKEQPANEEIKEKPEEPISRKKQDIAKEEKRQESTKDADLFSDKKTSTLADKLQGSNRASLYDRIGLGDKKGTLGERLKKNPVSDIKTAIGINEKFLFINELFNGNMHDYNNAIKRLNRAQNIEEAAIIFDELKNQYDWNSEGQTTLQLLDFVERRFM